MPILLQTLPDQLYLPQGSDRRKVPREGLVEAPQKILGRAWKPGGGLWTSTWGTALEAGWPWWLQREGYHRDGKWSHTHGYVLAPVESRVITISSGEDVVWFTGRYAVGSEAAVLGATNLAGLALANERWKPLRWDLVAEDADAVRVTTPYDPEVRYSEITSVFYGWDCESTWWARWRFEGKPRRVEVFR